MKVKFPKQLQLICNKEEYNDAFLTKCLVII